MQLVEQAPRQELLDQVGATAYPDMLLSGSRPRLRQRTVDSVRDEVKRCAALFDKRLALAVRHDKDWHVERRLVAPRPLAAIEHPPPHDNRAHILERFVHLLVFEAGCSAGQAVTLAPRRQLIDPLVQPLAVFA